MMLLAVDTTSLLATAALFQDGEFICELEADASKKHAETVLPMIDRLLEENGVSIHQVDVFAVDIGPGSFTGVRIGVSLINALAFAGQKPIIPIDSLRALYTASGERTKPVCALIDARNGNAYAAMYRGEETLTAPCAVEITPFVATLPLDIVFIGDVHTAEASFPRAKQVGIAALARLDSALPAVEPVYLRSSQAERMRKSSGKGA